MLIVCFLFSHIEFDLNQIAAYKTICFENQANAVIHVIDSILLKWKISILVKCHEWRGNRWKSRYVINRAEYLIWMCYWNRRFRECLKKLIVICHLERFWKVIKCVIALKFGVILLKKILEKTLLNDFRIFLTIFTIH